MRTTEGRPPCRVRPEQGSAGSARGSLPSPCTGCTWPWLVGCSHPSERLPVTENKQHTRRFGQPKPADDRPDVGSCGFCWDQVAEGLSTNHLERREFSSCNSLQLLGRGLVSWPLCSGAEGWVGLGLLHGGWTFFLRYKSTPSSSPQDIKESHQSRPQLLVRWVRVLSAPNPACPREGTDDLTVPGMKAQPQQGRQLLPLAKSRPAPRSASPFPLPSQVPAVGRPRPRDWGGGHGGAASSPEAALHPPRSPGVMGKLIPEKPEAASPSKALGFSCQAT